LSDNPRKKRLRILSTAAADDDDVDDDDEDVKQQQQLAVAPLTKGGLGIEVNEMICLWEALFPDDQNYFQLHQIKDLVSSIPMHGSMHAWSELFGEQALATLIAYSPLEFNATFIVLQDTVMQSIAEKIGITKAQLSLAWEAGEKNANRKTVEDIKVKGFKDVWPFDRLPYSDLARNCSPRHSQGRYL
jgi:hypothetical protein